MYALGASYCAMQRCPSKAMIISVSGNLPTDISILFEKQSEYVQDLLSQYKVEAFSLW